jgi:hypothetical protein
VAAAGANQPLIAIEQFSFHSGLFGYFLEPMHVRVVQVTNLQINIPPRQMREQAIERTKEYKGKMKIVVDEIICDKSRLIIGTSNPNKDPRDSRRAHVLCRRMNRGQNICA